MSIDFPNDDLEPLLEQLTLAELDTAEWETLRTLIADNPAAQRRYLEAVHLRESLSQLLRREPPAGAADDEAPPAADPASKSWTAESSIQPSARWRPDARRESNYQRRYSIPIWAAAAGVAFVAGAAAVALYHRADGVLARQIADVPRAVVPVISSPAPLVQDSKLGKISGLSLDASSDGLTQSMQVGQLLRCGEVVQLPVGFMRVQLDSGPELLIEGPAEFTLTSEESVFFRGGRVAAKGGRRLLLQTPLLTAECLDARVTFEATGDEAATIFVAEGVVTLMTTPQEQVESEKLRVLHSGEGIIAQPSGSAGVLRTSARGPMPQVIDSWRQIESRLSEYQQLVLSDRPIAYWPLYRVRKNRRVLDLTQNGHDGLPIGNWPVVLAEDEQVDDSGRGVYFNGECYIEPDRKPPMNMQNGFAIEGWAKPKGPAEYQAIFTSRWVRESYTANQQCFGVTLYAGDTNRWEFWTGLGKLGQFWNVMESPQEIERDSWSHVVGVFTPTGNADPGFLRGVGRLYVDGRQVLELEQEVSLTDFDWPARIGAAEFVPRYLTSWLFKGYLSDVALYGYPLETKRIEEHFKVGKPSIGLKTSRLAVPPTWRLASLERSMTP